MRLAVDIFSVISRHVDWLGARHSVTAANIANADTPGYQARTVSPFRLQDHTSRADFAATHPAHFTQANGSSAKTGTVLRNGNDQSHSGNDVVMEVELRALGENARGMMIDTSLAKLFHRLTMTSLKG
jgi:flagellar basal-body rod protein FlgB